MPRQFWFPMLTRTCYAQIARITQQEEVCTSIFPTVAQRVRRREVEGGGFNEKASSNRLFDASCHNTLLVLTAAENGSSLFHHHGGVNVKARSHFRFSHCSQPCTFLVDLTETITPMCTTDMQLRVCWYTPIRLLLDPKVYSLSLRTRLVRGKSSFQFNPVSHVNLSRGVIAALMSLVH